MDEIGLALSDADASAILNLSCPQCLSLQEELSRSRETYRAELLVLKQKMVATDKLIRKYKEKSQELESVKTQLRERDEQLVAVQGEVKALEFKLEESSANPQDIARLEGDNKWLQMHVDELKTRAESSEGLVLQLKSALNQKDKEVKDMVLELEIKNIEAKRAKHLQTSVKQLTDKLEATKKKVQEDRDANRELIAVQKKNAVLERQLKEARKEIENLKESTLNNKRENDDLKVANLIAFHEPWRCPPISPLPPSPIKTSGPFTLSDEDEDEDDTVASEVQFPIDTNVNSASQNRLDVDVADGTAELLSSSLHLSDPSDMDEDNPNQQSELPLSSLSPLFPENERQFYLSPLPLSDSDDDDDDDDNDDGTDDDFPTLSPLSPSLCRLLSPIGQSPCPAPLSPLPESPQRRRSVRLIERKKKDAILSSSSSPPPPPPIEFSAQAPDDALRVEAVAISRKRAVRATGGLMKRHRGQNEVQCKDVVWAREDVLKALLRLFRGDLGVEDLVAGFSVTENVSTYVQLAVGIVKSISRRRDDLNKEITRVCRLMQTSHNFQYSPVLLPYEIRLTKVILATKAIPSLSNTLESLYHMLPKSLSQVTEDQWNSPVACCRRSASILRLFTSLCHEEGEFDRVRIFCYNLLTEYRPWTAKELSALLAVVSTWPGILHRQPHYSMYREGRLCLDAVHPQPLLCAIEALIASQYSPSSGLDSWTKESLMTLCGWSKPPASCDVMQDYCLSTVSALVNHRDVDISMEDNLPGLSPLADEIVRAFELVSRWMGPQWTVEFLAHRCLRSIASEWERATQFDELAQCRIRPGAICAVVRLCGRLGRRSENSGSAYQELFTLVASLLANVEATESILPVQLSAVLALCDLSAWCSKAALAVIRRWIQRTQDSGKICLILPERLRERIDLMLKA